MNGFQLVSVLVSRMVATTDDVQQRKDGHAVVLPKDPGERSCRFVEGGVVFLVLLRKMSFFFGRFFFFGGGF